MKAKYVDKYYDNEHRPVLVYEYRGHRYEVVDFGWRGGEPLSWQHKNEQVRIDEEIEHPWHNAGESYETGLELFFSYYD